MSSCRVVLADELRKLQPQLEVYATQFTDRLLSGAQQNGASDVHLQPTRQGLDVRWRIDGVLQPLGVFPSGEVSDIVTRLKVLAGLLTYRQDIPQEGRIRQAVRAVEVRISSFPSLYGERAVVRLFAVAGEYLYPESLGFPKPIHASLQQLLQETSGAVLITGPAGSGKTTTAYACLRHLVRDAGAAKSVVSLEDPIEAAVDGVAQSQVSASADFDFASGLRSLMRQDPEVIFVGEIRDKPTAETVFQAALTGHLVVSTFHSGSSAGSVCRLSDMGIEPYLLRSGILGIVNQRLVRKLCDCKQPVSSQDFLGLAVESAWHPVGCSVCLGTGYHGRLPLAEILLTEPTPLSRAILSRSDATQLEALAMEAGMKTRWQCAADLVTQGLTSPTEVRRVLGFGEMKNRSTEG